MSYFSSSFFVLVLCCTVYTTWVEDRLTMYVTTVALPFPVRQGIIPVSGLCKLSGERGCSKLYTCRAPFTRSRIPAVGLENPA